MGAKNPRGLGVLSKAFHSREFEIWNGVFGELHLDSGYEAGILVGAGSLELKDFEVALDELSVLPN